MIVRWVKNPSKFLNDVMYHSVADNLYAVDSAYDKYTSYIRDDKDVAIYRNGLAIQVGIDEMPLYKDTIVDIFNGIMSTRDKRRFPFKEEQKEEILQEWMEMYDMYQWQRKNWINKFGEAAKWEKKTK